MSEPDVVTVGDPLVVLEYFAVGTLKITTPLPPVLCGKLAYFPPAPPPVFAVPDEPCETGLCFPP